MNAVSQMFQQETSSLTCSPTQSYYGAVIVG